MTARTRPGPSASSATQARYAESTPPLNPMSTDPQLPQPFHQRDLFFQRSRCQVHRHQGKLVENAGWRAIRKRLASHSTGAPVDHATPHYERNAPGVPNVGNGVRIEHHEIGHLAGDD